MTAVAEGVARPRKSAPAGLMTLVALLSHSTVHPALPPAQDTAAQAPTPNAAPQSDGGLGLTWFLPPVRVGGSVAYSIRSDTSAGQTTTQSTLNTTLNANTSINTYLWQPWFARVNGTLGISLMDSRDGNRASNSPNSSNQSVVVVGSGQLSVLAQSKFPFEAHFQRSDNRHSSDLALANISANQSFGFSQRYFYPQGDASLSWDRSTHTSAADGSDVQDSLQLRLAHRLEFHSLQLNGSRTTDKHENTGERAVQNNLALQHSYTPDPSISVESLVNVSRADYRLLQSRNDSRLLQLSSNAFWRPQGQPMTVTGGVRMYTVQTDSGGTLGTRLLNANANLGVTYEFNPFTRMNAAANVNMSDNAGDKSISTSQSVGVSYQPAGRDLGAFRYSWGTSASGSNSSSEQDSQRQLSLQFSHSLSRGFNLAGGSSIAADVSQSLALSASSSVANAEPAATTQLTHNGSVSWTLPHDSGSVLMRLSASDSRALDGGQDFYQLVNFQASSTLPAGRYSSWIGSLTLQATRQGGNARHDNAGSDGGFVTSSSGTIGYQNQRLFGYRRLRFTSDLRLNSDALLPLFGSSAAQELVALDNRLDYSIGRTSLSLNLLLSRSSSPAASVDAVTGAENTQKVITVNKSIMFLVTRNFGLF